jgi:hypothetical protein
VVDRVWHVLTYAYLTDMLQLCRAAMQRDVDRSIVPTFRQTLELTLPWGMDDGNAVIRLTVTGAHSTEDRGYDQRRFAVVVFAEAVRLGAELDAPRYPGHHFPPARRHSVPPLTRSVAEYLRAQAGGEPLVEVGDGSLRFALIAWAEPLTRSEH